MGLDFQKIQEQDHDHLRQIIRSDEPLDIKVQHICLWRQEKRFVELRNLLHYHSHQLLSTIAGRVDSGGRGLDFLRDKINLLRQKHKAEKEQTMKTVVTVSINGPAGVGKTTFLHNIKPHLHSAILDVLEGEVELVLEESNDTSRQEKAKKESTENLKEMEGTLGDLAALESKRYTAMSKMLRLLKDTGYCPKELDALSNMNEAENHNTSCLIDSIRKGL